MVSTVTQPKADLEGAKEPTEMGHSVFGQEWWKSWCKGKTQSFVARGEEPLSKVVKTLNTALKRGIISRSSLQALVKEVESESVTPFANWADYGTRLNRLHELKRSLGF